MENGQAFDPHQRFLAAVQGVEVGRLVVVKVHADDDAVKAAEFRHGPPERSRRASRLRPICR